MKKAVLTYYNNEVDPEIPEYHKKVIDKLNFGTFDYKPLFSPRPENEVTHKIYCFGGYISSTATDEILEYDPSTDTIVV